MILDMSWGIAVYKACADILLNDLAMNEFISSLHFSENAENISKKVIRSDLISLSKMSNTTIGGLTS